MLVPLSPKARGHWSQLRPEAASLPGQLGQVENTGQSARRGQNAPHKQSTVCRAYCVRNQSIHRATIPCIWSHFMPQTLALCAKDWEVSTPMVGGNGWKQMSSWHINRPQMEMFIGGPVDWEGGPVDWREWETWMGTLDTVGEVTWLRSTGGGCANLESE